MRTYSADRIHNVGLFSHAGAGKTTLAEAMLYETGVVNRMGKVDEGTTVSDYEPEEIDHRVSIHMSLLGETGLRQLAQLNHARACEAAEQLETIPGVSVINESFFNEFTVNLPVEARPAVHAMVQKGVLGGVSLGRLYPGVDALKNGLVIAVTETSTSEDIAALKAALEEVVQ